MATITIELSPAEQQGLALLASEELRTSEDQLRWLLREYLLERGLLQPSVVTQPARPRRPPPRSTTPEESSDSPAS